MGQKLASHYAEMFMLTCDYRFHLL